MILSRISIAVKHFYMTETICKKMTTFL